MTQVCYKTHREDPQTFPKINAVSTSQLLRVNTKGISNQYPNATRVVVSEVLLVDKRVLLVNKRELLV